MGTGHEAQYRQWRSRAYTVLIGLALSMPAQADRIWGHGLSKHADGNDYNEVNPGLGIEVQLTDTLSAEVGQYKNSFGRPTSYVLLHDHIGSYRGFDFGVAVGTADNYDCALKDPNDDTNGDENPEKAECREFEDGKGVPLGGLMIERWNSRLFLIPSKKHLVAVAALSVTVLEWE